jgi:type III pantothenate kinase
MRKLLVVDAGNTSTEFGVFEGQELCARFRFITKEKRTSDEIAVFLSQMFELNDLHFSDIENCIISSVVPDINFTLTNTIMKYLKVDPLMVEPGIKTGIAIKSDDPREVGADRIVDALAAYTLYGAPCIVLNFGTATRYDYVNEKGEFVAAITAPGIQISADALWVNAAKLPKIEIAKPDSILAKNTITSMQAGLVYGQIGQTEYIVRQIRKETGTNAISVASGGYANIIKPYTDAIDVYDPELTLKGLRLIYEKNTK